MSTTTSNATTAANAASFELNKEYSFSVKGFTYIKEWAFLVIDTFLGNQRIIIGSKSDFPMTEMFAMKQAASVAVTYKGVKNINGVDYHQFRLDCIEF